MKRPPPATTEPLQPIGAAALVCAWCGAPKPDAAPADASEHPVSHGLCGPCARRLTRRRV